MDHSALTEEFRRADRMPRPAPAAVRPGSPEARRLRSEARARRRERWRATRRAAAVTAVAVALLLGIACFPLAWYQRSLIYWATETPAAEAARAQGFAIRRYSSDIGGSDYLSYVKEGRPGLPTVVYLHGRGEDLRIAAANTGTYASRGWTVVIPEYPGFAGLRGTPGEKSIQRLLDLAYDDLVSHGRDPDRIVIHGNSLGGGPAIMLAGRRHGFLLLTAPVARLSEVVGDWVPFVPMLLLRDRWDNVERAHRRRPSPAAVVQAVDDQVVPIGQGRALAEATGATMVELPEGGHAVGWNGERLTYDPARGFSFRR